MTLSGSSVIIAAASFGTLAGVALIILAIGVLLVGLALLIASLQ